MSASTIARWNSIPLSREDEPSLKRSNPEEGTAEDSGSGDDDISFLSRTPSPSPLDNVDVDRDLSKYDEYIRGAPREVITVETKIKPTNKGFAMLAKLGWSEGQPLGISGDGRVDPIPFQIKRDSTGLGKINQDVRMIETTVAQRRGMDSERQRKETEDQRRAREKLVARKTALESELSTTLRAFYCTLCDKQFKTVAQYDEHTNSYAHHHRARFKDMQANARLKPKEDVDKRKEKERKREEKELRKIAAANGIKMVKPPPTITPSVNLDPAAGTNHPTDVNAISSTAEAPQFQPPVNKTGWASVGSEPAVIPPREPSPNPSSRRSNVTSTAPSFRTAGWTFLDTGSPHEPPPGAPPSQPSSINSRSPLKGGWSVIEGESSRGGAFTSTSSFLPPPPIDVTSLSPPCPPPEPVRSGWQQFRKSMPRR